MKLFLSIITPVKPLLEKDEVDEVIAPTTEGEITILPNHVDLFTKIAPGELTVKKGDKMEHIAITGGFLEILSNNITILADHAIRAEDVEVAKAKEAEEKARQKMKEKESEKDFIIAEAELRKALLELKVARKIKIRPS